MTPSEANTMSYSKTIYTFRKKNIILKVVSLKKHNKYDLKLSLQRSLLKVFCK